MTTSWQSIKLGKVLRQDTNYVTELEPKIYPKLSVKLYGRGVTLDAPADGANIRMKRHQFAKPGQAILSEIWAKKGAIGIVPPEGDGALVTSHFFLFDIDETKVLSAFIGWLLKGNYFADALDAKAHGTTGYAAVRPKQFLSLEIHLPPLDEQRRIVARIEALAGRIAEARSLRQLAAEEAEAVWKSSLADTFSPKNNHKTDTLENVCEAIIDNLHSTPKYDGNEFACIRSQDVGWGTLNYSTALRTSLEEFTERIKRGEPKTGDIVFVREGDIGRCAVVDGSQRFCLGQRVMMFRPDTERILSNFLMYQLMSSPVLNDQILERKTGTTSHHVNIKHLRQITLQIPPPGEQRRIVAYLDGLSERVSELRRLQAESQAELDALLPSILDKAFKGEL